MKFLKKFKTEQDLVITDTPSVYLIDATRKVGYVQGNLPVRIQHIDGSLYSADEWFAGGFTNDKANGVVVLTEKGNILLAKEQYTCEWGGYYIEIAGLSREFGSGESNTTKIINAIGDNGGVEYAALKASSYTFPDGNHGFLPSIDEWAAIAPYIKLANSYLSTIGGKILNGSSSSNTVSWYASSYSDNDKYSADNTKLLFNFIHMDITILQNAIDESRTTRSATCVVLPIRILD